MIKCCLVAPSVAITPCGRPALDRGRACTKQANCSQEPFTQRATRSHLKPIFGKTYTNR